LLRRPVNLFLHAYSKLFSLCPWRKWIFTRKKAIFAQGNGVGKKLHVNLIPLGFAPASLGKFLLDFWIQALELSQL
jgi:hypothetical protein